MVGCLFLPPVTCEVAFHVYDNPGELGRSTSLCLIRVGFKSKNSGCAILYTCMQVYLMNSGISCYFTGLDF